MDENPSRRVSVSEMTGDDRRSVENLLGHPLQEGQQVYILAFSPGVAPDESTRQWAQASMQQTFAKAEQHAQQQNVSEEEIDAALDEGMERIRYGKA
jgi:hypothetical protein